MTERRLSLEAELWVVEELLFSARKERIAEHLVRHGLSEGEAREQVARLDQRLGPLRGRLAQARRGAQLWQLRRDLDPPPSELPVAHAVDAATLHARHWRASVPLHLPGWGRELAPVRRWSLVGLRDRLGHVEVSANVGRDRARRPADVERAHAPLRLADLIDRALGPPGDDTYAVSADGLLATPGLRPLWDDLHDLPEPLVAPTPPHGVAMWLGPAGTHTRPHFDPHNVLLLQVEGRKELRIAPPPGPDHAAIFEGWYLDGPVDALSPLTLTLGPGDALFLPAGWVHDVRALCPSITLSLLCFPWPNHFHYLGPTGSDDR